MGNNIQRTALFFYCCCSISPALCPKKVLMLFASNRAFAKLGKEVSRNMEADFDSQGAHFAFSVLSNLLQVHVNRAGDGSFKCTDCSMSTEQYDTPSTKDPSASFWKVRSHRAQQTLPSAISIHQLYECCILAAVTQAGNTQTQCPGL